MYELINAGKNTWYINSPAKVGIYVFDGNRVVLIDSGNDKDAGKKIQKILDGQGWVLDTIISTHSNADHIGGNRLLQNRLGCRILAKGAEAAVTRYPVLEPAMLYGGYPCSKIRNKFLMAEPSDAAEITADALPAGLELIELPGHYLDMTGIKTDDNVYFLADCLVGENVLEKYQVSFLYDVDGYLKTLEMLETLPAGLFIPAHAEPTEDIIPLARKNRDKVLEIASYIESLCAEPAAPDDILKSVFEHFGITMDFGQYVLVGSTVRSYLSYLHDSGKITADFADNRLLWHKV
ncbi:MAG: MBL fold metallo-hydrolase [Oscillospiraceae bacterium]|nr:MBL fold metallo-hydrolase [Oscillospiraceae bacterium]